MAHDGHAFILIGVFSTLTHQTEVPRSPRSEKGEGAASLQWRSTGNESNKQWSQHNIHFCHQNCIHCDFVGDLFCALDIYCTSVSPPPPLPEVSPTTPRPLLTGFLGEFFLIRFEGLMTEVAVCCADRKAPWGKVWFVILVYINKKWLDTMKTSFNCLCGFFVFFW